jgi:hypothetical protein
MTDIDRQEDTSGVRGAAITLVRITHPSRLAGVITCLDHLTQLRDLIQRQSLSQDDQERPAFLYVEMPREIVELHAHRCLMCGVMASPNRRCENDSCARKLHPQWPAVYCCNECAWEDA